MPHRAASPRIPVSSTARSSLRSSDSLALASSPSHLRRYYN